MTHDMSLWSYLAKPSCLCFMAPLQSWKKTLKWTPYGILTTLAFLVPLCHKWQIYEFIYFCFKKKEIRILAQSLFAAKICLTLMLVYHMVYCYYTIRFVTRNGKLTC